MQAFETLEAHERRTARQSALFTRWRACCASGSSSSAHGSTFEVGKNWAEADADVAETIDFWEFYPARLSGCALATTPIQLPGERNELLYIPLGVGAVIPPWNFPFAIMAGMTAAAIVTGNTVILKPSSDSPTIAAKFVEVLEETGMPDGVVNFCPDRAPRSATPSCSTRRRASSLLRARRRWAWTSTSARPRPTQGRSGSSGPSWRWAARTRSWWRGCGCGRGRRWSGGVGLRIQRAEVLGLLAGHYRGPDLRHLRGAGAGAGRNS